MPHLVPYLPDDAPFSAEQRAWLNGFFAGWSTRARSGDGAALYPPPGGDGQPPAGDGQARGWPVPADPPPPHYSRTHPFPARLRTNRPLNAAGSAKDVRHLEIDLDGSGLTYEAGDALGVIPQNCPAYVENLIDALGWRGDEPVVIDGASMPLREALQTRLTITQPPRALLDAYAERSNDDALTHLLEDRQTLHDFLRGRDVLDLVLRYPAVRFEPQSFVDLLRPLQHRLYSISSSPRAHPGEVHLTVGCVRYEAHGRLRKGVCSTFLAERCAPEDPLPVFVHPNTTFRLPADTDTPIIMIGPGTGIAPFRGFLYERRATGARGKNWLIFGDQHAATDFLYRDELEGFLQDGTLDRLDLAWSRDGAEKVYVQHRLREHARTLFDWLEDGAVLYVCGDAARMARDVDAALHDVLRTAGALSEEAAAAYVTQLKQARRYLRDVY